MKKRVLLMLLLCGNFFSTSFESSAYTSFSYGAKDISHRKSRSFKRFLWRQKHRFPFFRRSPQASSYVFDVLDYIEKHNGKAPPGYVGGRVFSNYDRRLPINAYYHEYDVHPLRQGVNRGAERLVRGNDGTAFYTQDHYRTFKRIK